MINLLAFCLFTSQGISSHSPEPPSQVIKLIPKGLTLNEALCADLDGDGSDEWVIVCTRAIKQDAKMQEQFNQVSVCIYKKTPIGWRPRGWKEAGSNFTSMRLVQADGGKGKEIAVFCYYPGGDFGVETVDVFGLNRKGVEHLGQGGGCNGGVEVGDYDGDGLAEIKGWSELWRREQSHAEVYEHITKIQRVRQGKFVTYKAYLYDSKSKLRHPLTPLQAARMLRNRG